MRRGWAGREDQEGVVGALMPPRIPGIRPVPALLRGKVRALYKSHGENGAVGVLGVGRPVVHRVMQGFSISKETEMKIWLALQEHDRLGRVVEESSKERRQVVVTRETSPRAELTRLEATRLFKEKVWDRPREIDPDDDHSWETLAYGFFLALGFEVSDAKSLAYLVTDSDFYESK